MEMGLVVIRKQLFDLTEQSENKIYKKHKKKEKKEKEKRKRKNNQQKWTTSSKKSLSP